MMKGQKGTSLLEVLVAMALLGIVSVLFLGSVASSSSARVTADTRVSAKILAESIMDEIKGNDFELSYDDFPIPPEFDGFSANVTVTSLANGNIQKLTVVVKHFDTEVLTLESYKVER